MKFKNRLPYVKSVVICDIKTKEQKVHNIAPGGVIEVTDEAYALSEGFKVIVAAGQFMQVSAEKASAPAIPAAATSTKVK